MRVIAVLLVAYCVPLWAADSSEEKDVIAAAQKLFDAMSAHDADAARAAMLPDVHFTSVGSDGKVTGLTGEQFAVRMGEIKKPLMERIWAPKVLISGHLAQLWADYDVYFDGKFGHCGVDVFTLAKTADGWKIAAVADTRETEGCAPSPLGPPAGH
jgi:ketosteroid isomerase-like protein